MNEGLNELAVVAPEFVARASKTKWRCGVVKIGEGVAVQILDSERFRLLVDDLKKYWDFLNPTLPFQMGTKDGAQIRRFLSDHRQWIQDDWRTALNHRKSSVAKYGHAALSEPLWMWVGHLDNYSSGPLDRWNKPAGNGGKRGETIDIRQGNREAVERAVANA
jgi:hypothetical protein